MKYFYSLTVLAFFAFINMGYGVIDISDKTEKVDIYPYPVEGGLSAPEGQEEWKRFCGWPANGKMFAWGDELLLIFSYSTADDGTGTKFHGTGKGKSYLWSVRSFDGGLTWTDKSEDGAGEVQWHDAVPLDKPINFRDPGLALLIRMTGSQQGPSRILYSTDRGRHWNGYYELLAPGFNPVAARSDYIIEGKHKLRMFSAAGFDADEAGTTPYQWVTRDGGMSWKLLGRTGLDIVNMPEWRWSIMPATVKLSDGTFVQAARTKSEGEPARNYHPVHRSTDGGKTWKLASEVFLEDVPLDSRGYHTPSDLDLIPGTDTIVCTYVDRANPSRVLAKISTDKGLSWGDEIVLRKDGGGGDLGYPETVVRADGKFVTVAYWYIEHDPKSWSGIYDPRFLAFTIWDPKDAM